MGINKIFLQKWSISGFKYILITVILVLFVTGCADAGLDQTVSSSSKVTLDGSNSKADFRGEIIKYQWKQIKGKKVALLDTKSVKATFEAPVVTKKTILSFKLTTIEKTKYHFSNKTSDKVDITIEPVAAPNKPPHAAIDTNTSLVKEGQSVTFSASNSKDDDGDIVSYRWEDNTTNETIGSKVDITHTFNSIGKHTITLVVTDNKGATNSATKEIEIIPAIKNLELNTTQTQLKENAQANLTLKATYTNNTIKDITDNIDWIVEENQTITINNNTIKALKEGTTTLQAKVDNTLSNKITITVYKEISGHRLPPEPDPKVNNATLLGVDVNHNGVRDDVERWIIIHYAKDPKYPKTKTAIALQYAWASQKILENPTMESRKYIDDALDCQRYWAWKRTQKDTQGMSGFEAGKYYSKLTFLTDPVLKDKIYNTRARISQKFSFNAALGGHIFDGRNESINNCRTNIDKLGE